MKFDDNAHKIHEFNQDPEIVVVIVYYILYCVVGIIIIEYLGGQLLPIRVEVRTIPYARMKCYSSIVISKVSQNRFNPDCIYLRYNIQSHAAPKLREDDCRLNNDRGEFSNDTLPERSRKYVPIK